MAGIEAFTVMAILDAQDHLSGILEKCSGVFEQFGAVMRQIAGVSEESGAAIDASLLTTETGANALQLATERLAATEMQRSVALQEQAAAEANLSGILQADAVEADRLAAALERLKLAEKDTATATAELSAAQTRLATTSGEAATAETAAATAAGGPVTAITALAVGMAAAGGMSVKAAGDFQNSVVHLVTDANESADAIGLVSKGMIDMAGDVGTSAQDLAYAMYRIESAGFHAQSALDVLKVAAEGAKVGNADLDAVAKTLAGTLDSYGLKAKDAASVMNMLIETTASGDLRMQDLATTLGNVSPIAAAAGISLDQVGGAIATMTVQNMTAAQATQNLANFISHLANPIGTQITQMQALGIDVNDLTSKLGERGLVGTLQILVDAIDKAGGHNGVFINSFKKSQDAAADAKKMLELMPPAVKQLATELEKGQIGVGDYNKAIKELSPEQYKMGKQFDTLHESMGAFNQLLSSGKPEAETFNAALAKLTGGQIGLRTALMLSSEDGEYFRKATEDIADAGKDASGEVKNWDTIQGTFNNQIERAKASIEALAIRVGTYLLPVIQKLVGWLDTSISWLMKHKEVAQGLAISLGVPLVAAIVAVGAVLVAVMAVVGAITAAFYGLYRAIEWLINWTKQHGKFFSDIWHDVMQGVRKAADWFDKNVLQWIRERIQDFQKWWGEHSDQITTVWRALWGTIQVIFEIAWGILKAGLTFLSNFWDLMWGMMKDTVIMAWDIIKNVLKTAFDVIKGVVSIGLDIITGKWGQAWHDAIQLVKDVFWDVWHFLSDFFKDAWSWLYDAGKNIIKGLVDGIKSAWGSVKSTISDLAGTIRNYFPFSPAKVGPLSGRGDIGIAGKNISTMLADGMHSGVSAVDNASRAVARAARPNVGGAGFGLGLPALSSGGYGGNVTIIDVRNSQLMTDRDMDAFVNKVGRRLATTILPAGGVRIRS